MDPNQRKQIIILSVLGVAVLGIVWYQFFRPALGGGESTAAVAHTTPEAVQSVKSVFQEVDFDISELVQSIKEVDFDYSETQLARDPLAPLIGGTTYLNQGDGETGGTPLPLDNDLIYLANRKTVTGILWDDVTPMAVLSELGEPDEIVTEGMEFGGGIVIQDIQPNQVLFALKLENEMRELVKELKEQ